jgi:hypothetical protein
MRLDEELKRMLGETRALCSEYMTRINRLEDELEQCRRDWQSCLEAEAQR